MRTVGGGDGSSPPGITPRADTTLATFQGFVSKVFQDSPSQTGRRLTVIDDLLETPDFALFPVFEKLRQSTSDGSHIAIAVRVQEKGMPQSARLGQDLSHIRQVIDGLANPERRFSQLFRHRINFEMIPDLGLFRARKKTL